MARRLVESYQLGDFVEITFDKLNWQPGQVARLEHPGVWVQAENGRLWYVTNTHHIRHTDANPKVQINFKKV